MQVLTKRCGVTHQVEQLDCEGQLEEVMRFWGKTNEYCGRRVEPMSIDLKPLSCFISYLDSLLIAIKLLLYSTDDKGKQTKDKIKSNVTCEIGRIQLSFWC